MLSETDRIKRDFLRKEEQLLDDDFRGDAANVAGILSEGSLEITESGKTNMYRAGTAFPRIDGALYIDTDSARLADMADGCKLLTYVAGRVVKNARTKITCASLWKKTGDDWKIAFHQRTVQSE